MKLCEAMDVTPVIKIGFDARSVIRTDRRGRNWCLISIRGQMVLLRQDKSGFLRVSEGFASRWTDWRPQSAEGAAQEAAVLGRRDGWRLRNSIFKAILGPLPEQPEIPEFLPDDVN